MATIDQMSVRDLQCIVMLAETLNFTETAERLYMTQPGLTARITKAEKTYGYRFFDRSKGSVRATTPVGFVFVEEARKILKQLHVLIESVDAAHRAFSETLCIGRSTTPTWIYFRLWSRRRPSKRLIS